MNDELKESFFYNTLPEKDREEILSLIDQYRNSHITLSEIFNTDPEIYAGVPIDKIGLSVRSSNALRRGEHSAHTIKFRVNTLYDLLICSLYQLGYVRNFGMCSLLETVYTIKKYINRHKETFGKKLSYSKDINQSRLAYGLGHIINKEPLNNIILHEDEIPYIQKYTEAVEWIDKSLYIAAYNKDASLIGILRSLSEFFAPIYRRCCYRQKIEYLLAKLPPALQQKTACYFIQAYLINHETISKNILNEPALNDVSISEVIHAVCSKPQPDYNTYNYISRFLLWLNFNFNIVIGDDLRSAMSLKPEHIRIKSAMYAHKIEELYHQCGYDVAAVARAFKGKSRLVYKQDISHLIGAESANILWHIISIIKYRTCLYHYSAETGVIIFNE